jgi:hypothetical protein
VAGFDQIAGLWEDGLRRLREAEGPDRVAQERVVDVLVTELRRRHGGRFTADQLAAYYLQEGTDWCFEIATRVAPGNPAAWDMATVANAAFARYVRAASDYGGGQRRYVEEDG